MQTLEQKTIYITNVDVVCEDDGYYVIVEYNDGDYDEFGPYDSYQEAKSAIYWRFRAISKKSLWSYGLY
jgi:hypothetical protein